MLSRRHFLSIAASSPVWAAAVNVPTRSVKVVQTYKSPGPKPNGLQATKDGLWILDQGDNRAYLVEYESGKTLRALDTDSKAGSGITFDGEALWFASTYSREIIRADAKTGKTIAKFESPGNGPVAWSQGRSSPLAPKPAAAPKSIAPAPPKQAAARQATGAHGLEWKDGKLWISNPPSQTVYRMDPKAWKEEFKFSTAGDRPHGLGWEGDWLWCVDSNLNAFFKHDIKTGKIHERVQLTDADPLPHGMTIWNGWMWYCDDVGVVCKFKLR
jgi:sugar lactone lactonase YvrE